MSGGCGEINRVPVSCGFAIKKLWLAELLGAVDARGVLG